MGETRLDKVIAAIDQINLQDDREEMAAGKSWPKEYLYSKRASEILHKYWPAASEELQIAVRGHHVKRWAIQRSDFPMDRKGYLQWRTKLKLLHAELLSEILEQANYSSQEIKEVTQMVMKNKLKTDTNTQILEDVICLVFLEYYLEDFIVKHPKEKVISILQKTWGKMTENGHELALSIDFSQAAGDIVKEALEG